VLYSLPNGKVINISIEMYLELSAQDIQDLNGMNIGGSSADPFQDLDGKEPEEETVDHSPLEYLTDEDEPSHEIDLDALFLDDDSPNLI
jgi:hypothetical protein